MLHVTKLIDKNLIINVAKEVKTPFVPRRKIWKLKEDATKREVQYRS